MTTLAEAWEARYAAGGDSGVGSRGEHAAKKAAYVNALIEREQIRSVLDWGCGDGLQLSLLQVPNDYVGIDISASAVARCIERFPGRRFVVADPATAANLGLHAELALSMDVMFHLVADRDFRSYIRALFRSARRFVCIHATDEDRRSRKHMRHRRWTPFVAEHFPEWELIEQTAGTGENFFLYRKTT